MLTNGTNWFDPLVQMLRLMKDYDEHQTLLLPPRVPGEKLPEEIVEFYEEQKKRLEEEEEEEKAKIEAEIAANAAAAAAAQAAEGKSTHGTFFTELTKPHTCISCHCSKKQKLLLSLHYSKICCLISGDILVPNASTVQNWLSNYKKIMT